MRSMPKDEGLLLEIGNCLDNSPKVIRTVEQGLAEHLGVDRG